jgi:hypothetical protein
MNAQRRRDDGGGGDGAPEEEAVIPSLEEMMAASAARAAQLRAELDAMWGDSLREREGQARVARGAALWQRYRGLTAAGAASLCEQLRMLLEPLEATRLAGDYRTGKRLNIRRVIPYIASNFRRDRIWLRRSKPAKRSYQIAIAIDDTVSDHAALLRLLATLRMIAFPLIYFSHTRPYFFSRYSSRWATLTRGGGRSPSRRSPW